ncbi:MAG: hypothetical protein ISR08_05160 [Candidatus Poseidoniaceae archaeon]|nr:hypothetical protein [Candidatus Poseidoniaceae archaeon]
MSGVWREQSVPMTDRECALLALESIDAVVTNHTNTQCAVTIGGRSWTMHHTNGRYAIRYNAQNRTSRPTWMDGLSEAYSQQVRLKQERLARQEQVATLEADREALHQERLAMEEERKALIETRRATVIKQAKALGYRVKESVQNGEVRLVLVKTG